MPFTNKDLRGRTFQGVNLIGDNFSRADIRGANFQSVREAREKLQRLENDFPCATWLPVIFQNPAEIPPKWEDISNGR